MAGNKSTDTACVFCGIDAAKVLAAKELAFALHNALPVTPLHSLALPKGHAASFFELTEAEAQTIERLVRHLRDDILAEDPSVERFNIEISVGEVAGQTISRCHYHLIPRRRGDVPDPRGGVRWVIPSKGSY